MGCSKDAVGGVFGETPFMKRHKKRIPILGYLLGLALVILPRGYLAHHLPFGGVILAEVVLLWTSVRLVQVTRLRQSNRSKASRK